ncbi:flavodoxin domain-containing protein [Peribacillus asahii]|uniref:flavodoxin domain-containing protein n=1 Tax=Peribacillus asahii TaxID=228899 RepID=UPI00207A0C5D|nr:flavodoxin domain-containing protein [Peribacillus asahii]USK60590.1 flavodoxin domain-containing protein [Peribacillus asahii]
MRIAIVYHSGSGNTKALAEMIASFLPEAKLFKLGEFDSAALSAYDGLLIGSYTWGDGDLPAKMIPFYKELEATDISHLTTAVFGTGETNYHHFCGAVNLLRDMLYAHSSLAVTLKVEQMYQTTDLPRIEKFTTIFKQALQSKMKNTCITKELIS